MIVTPLCQRIIVRYARKPIWMPTAPSKLFRIPEHTFYSAEEVTQIQIIQRAYKAQEESIKEFMKHEFYIPRTQSGGLPAAFIKQEQEIDQQLLEENNRENARIAKLKEEYLTKQLNEMEEKLMEEKITREETLTQKARTIDDYILATKEKSDAFVTPENIESMIDEAMENPTNLEFCIDRSGRKYTLPVNQKPQSPGELV